LLAPQIPGDAGKRRLLVKRSLRLIAILGLFALAPAARAVEPDGIQIGMVQGMFRDVQPAMVQALSKPLRDMIQKSTGLTGDVEILPDGIALADRMKGKKLQLGVFHGFEYAWARKQHPDLVPLVVTVPPGRKLQACIVVHKDSTATSLADLKDTAVIVPRGTKAHCYLYIERLKLGLPATTATLKTKPAMTTEEALDAILAEDATAALVDIGALTGYQNLQPGAFKNLRILCQSDPFPQTVLVANKGSLNEETLGKIRKLLVEAHNTPAGKPLMMLWNLKGFEEVPADYDLQLDRIAKAYAPPARAVPLTPAGGTTPKEK